MVAEVAQAFPDTPIVGMGGVMTGQDALEFIACGATAVAVGAANFTAFEAPRAHPGGAPRRARGARLLVRRRGARRRARAPDRAPASAAAPAKGQLGNAFAGRTSVELAARHHIYSRAMSSSSKQFNTAPARSLDQRMDALGKANEVRSRRAALKADLKHGA